MRYTQTDFSSSTSSSCRDATHRRRYGTFAMNLRLLLAILLLVLASNAHAAMDRIHSASGDSSSPCPSAVLTDPGDMDESKADISTSAAAKPANPRSSTSASPVMQRPTLRWHSFLPGMMK